MIKFDLKPFLEHPGIVSRCKDDLIIFNYNRTCEFDRLWDEYSLQARGLILNRNTGEVVARPFPKFFNLNQTPKVTLGNLPKEPFTATIKEDGVLGISYRHKGRFCISTRGAFESPWALWATKWANNQENMLCDRCNPAYTYLFEIISPMSRVIVNYEGKEALVLIGVIEIDTGRELAHEELVEEAARIKVEPVKQVKFDSIEEMARKAEEISINEEGWVITFQSGLKVKIKGVEYKRIIKLVSHITPIAFWEAWKFDHLKGVKNPDYKDVGISKEWLAQIPEEFRDTTDFLRKTTDEKHWKLWHEAEITTKRLEVAVALKRLQLFYLRKPRKRPRPEPGEASLFAEEVRCYTGNKIVKACLHSMKIKDYYSVWYTIHKLIRPYRNIVDGYIFGIRSHYKKSDI